MEIRKSHKADLDRKRPWMFAFGLLLSLALFFAAMEYSVDDDDLLSGMDYLAETANEIEIIHPVPEEQLVEVTLPPKEIPMVSERFNIVDEDVDVEQVKEAVVTETEVTADSKQSLDEEIPNAVDADSNKPVDFRIVEKLPEFPGGIKEFMKWITSNLNYPAEARNQKKQGRVLVSFIVNRDGSVGDIKVVKQTNPYLDREAMRVMRMMPKWKPGEDNGKPCRTMVVVPVVFSL